MAGGTRSTLVLLTLFAGCRCEAFDAVDRKPSFAWRLVKKDSYCKSTVKDLGVHDSVQGCGDAAIEQKKECTDLISYSSDKQCKCVVLGSACSFHHRAGSNVYAFWGISYLHQNLPFANDMFIGKFDSGMPVAECEDLCTNWEVRCPASIKGSRSGHVHRPCDTVCVGFKMHGKPVAKSKGCTLYGPAAERGNCRKGSASKALLASESECPKGDYFEQVVFGCPKPMEALTTEAEEMAFSMRNQIERHAGLSGKAFEPKSLSAQMTSGVTYVIKIGIDKEHCIEATIFTSAYGLEPELRAVQNCKGGNFSFKSSLYREYPCPITKKAERLKQPTVVTKYLDLLGGALFDCSLDKKVDVKEWSASKKAWCCLHKGKKCDVQFDCYSGGPHHRWSTDKKDWCCEHMGKACPTALPAKSCHELGWRDRIQDVGGNLDGSIGIPGVCGEVGLPCQGMGSFAEANAYCHSKGARLCQDYELHSLESAGDSCHLDHSYVWSATPCGEDLLVPAHKLVRVGKTGAATWTKCSGTGIDSRAYMGRCCANVQATCSEKSCGELRWDVDASKGPSVCGSKGLKLPRSKVDYETASKFCTDLGARLCTTGELMQLDAGEKHFYGSVMWSSSPCPGGNISVVQVDRSGMEQKFHCVQATSEAHHGRCCGDVAGASTCGRTTHAPTTPPTPPTPEPTSVPTAAPTPYKPPEGARIVGLARNCHGHETEHGTCPDLPPCSGTCKPQDCYFNSWSEWYDLGGCSGLLIRQRAILQTNNECGAPCNAATAETKRSHDNSKHPECHVASTNCSFSEWSQWTGCSGPYDHMTRVRQVARLPEISGAQCVGPLKETLPCTSYIKDCAFSDWSAGGHCSASCGGGVRQQMRSIIRRAEYGGSPCEGPTQKAVECGTEPCPEDADCKLSDWSDWGSCDLIKRQRQRSRQVLRPAVGSGQPCGDTVEEIGACEEDGRDVRPECAISDWSDWSACGSTCQTVRQRVIQDTFSKDLGRCPAGSMREVRPCHDKDCQLTKDCQFDAWSSWSTCSASCGQGAATRSRSVPPSLEDAPACMGPLEEVKSCTGLSACDRQDCVWDTWSEWSACSATCGGGTKRRDRTVLHSPTGEGKLCNPENTSMIEPCHTMSCGKCTDGQWGDWSEWSSCSGTCDSGFQSRHRDISVEADSCGKPVTGLQDDYRQCANELPPCVEPRDCELTAWSTWSSCSATCLGVRERTRNIKVQAKGDGKSCVSESLKEISSCSSASHQSIRGSAPCPKVEKSPCKLDHWSSWSSCSATCDGGQKTRSRGILASAQHDGEPCSDALSEIVACGTLACDTGKRDCVLGDWDDWGACTKCGGQRFRHRAILQRARLGGKLCDPTDMRQTISCTSECTKAGKQFCTWSDWSAYGACTADCGPSTRSRSRALQFFPELSTGQDYLFVALGDSVCTGSQMEVTSCKTSPCDKSCEPVDCVFGDWNDWGGATCTQLCERSRSITRHGECGGTICDGQIVETKHCAYDCRKKEDCLLGAWEAWSHCTSKTDQSSRSRAIEKEAANGGVPCQGILKETKFCGNPPPPTSDCEFGSWGSWSDCSASCDRGYKTRSRTILTEATGGGELCLGSLQDMVQCGDKNGHGCPGDVDCKTSSWSDWSSCEHSQSHRSRHVVTEGTADGAPCLGGLKEIRTCVIAVIDCVVSDWSPFGECDRECGGGQQHRLRHIARMPANGGAACPQALMETTGCAAHPCDDTKDCTFSDWSEWSDCDVTCGTGQATRVRALQGGSMLSGRGCKGELEEIKGCMVKPCETVDCVWDDWTTWSDCSCTCGGGQRTRDRNIKNLAQRGGKPCELTNKEEVEPCHTQPCSSEECVDGQWGNWKSWSECTKSCGGGLTWRWREVAREANECGNPAVGMAHQTATCNDDVGCEFDQDCKFGTWSVWSGCSQTCFGVRGRTRPILKLARGQGKSCEGALKQVEPCNPGSGEPAARTCSTTQKQDCVVGDWDSWTQCSATCGAGSKERSRSVTMPPQGSGNPCPEHLKQVKPCKVQECEDVCHPVDCQWGDWGRWGACDKCGGQKKRYRVIAVPPACGGKFCDGSEAYEESMACERKCHDHAWCVWDEWLTWGDCDSHCGSGSRERSRYLKVVGQGSPTPKYPLDEIAGLDDVDDLTMATRLEELQQRTHDLKVRRLQNLAAAFAAGGFGLIALVTAIRLVKRNGHPDQGQLGLHGNVVSARRASYSGLAPSHLLEQ